MQKYKSLSDSQSFNCKIFDTDSFI